MSKNCQHCGHSNDDDHIFCRACGEPLDAELQLMMSVKEKNAPADNTQHTAGSTDFVSALGKNEDDDIHVRQLKTSRQHTAAPWIAFGVCALLVVLLLIFFL